MKPMKDKRRIWLAAGALFAAAAVTAAAVILNDAALRQKMSSFYQNLAKNTNNGTDVTQQTETMQMTEMPDEDGEPVVNIPEKDLDWDALKEENEDIYAWIYMPEIDIDYPILQHPSDNAYYLDHNIDGTKGYPGVIYSEDYNAKDFSDIHTVLYGHNLKDGTMFTPLHELEDEDFFRKDHYIYIYTEDGSAAYQVFAAYEHNNMHLLDNFDFTNEYVYEDYLKQIYDMDGGAANVREDIMVTPEDKILTLSTCTADHNSDLRFLVTGRFLCWKNKK